MQSACNRANMVSRHSKHYYQACRLLHVTQYLKTPFYLPCVVEDFGEDDITLRPVHLQHVKRSQRRITYSSLSLSDKPAVWCCFALVFSCQNRPHYGFRLSLHPSVHPVWALNTRAKRHRRTKLEVSVSHGWSNWCANNQFKWFRSFELVIGSPFTQGHWISEISR